MPFAVLRRALAWLARLEITASVLALAAICILTLAAVINRQFLNGSILWAEEVSLLLMKVVVFLGAAGMYATRSFISVDGLVKLAAPRQQRFVHLVNWAAIAGFAAIVFTQGILTYPSQIAARTYLLELPKFYFFIPLIIGAASILLTSLYFIAAILTHRATPGAEHMVEAEVAPVVSGTEAA